MGLKSSIIKSAFYCLTISTLACSSHVDFPTVNTPVQQINSEACAHVELNLKNLTPSDLRGVVHCLDGPNGALAPYKKFLDKTTDRDIASVLSIYNRHIVSPESRLSLILDLLDRLKKDGGAKDFFGAFEVLIENKTIQNFLPLISRYFLKSDSQTEIDPVAINSFGLTRKLIEAKTLSPLVVALGKAFDSIHARAFAFLMGGAGGPHSLNSDRVVDLLTEIFSRSLSDQTFHKMIVHLSDPGLFVGLQKLNDQELSALAGILAFRPDSGGANTARYSKLIAGADQPLNCIKNGNSFQKTNNLFHLAIQEIANRPSGEAVRKFILRDLTFLWSATQEVCDFSQDVADNRSLLFDTVGNGYGDGVRSVAKIMEYGGRFGEMTSALESPYLTSVSPLLEELGNRNALIVGLQALNQDLDPLSLKIIGNGLTAFYVNDSQNSAVSSWVLNHTAGDTQKKILALLSALPQDRQNFVGLKSLVENSGDDELLRELIGAFSQSSFENSSEIISTRLWAKIISSDPQARSELKSFVRSLTESFGDSRSGLGNITGALAHGVSLSDDNPIQEAVAETLGDQELLTQLIPALVTLKDNPYFADALDFTAKLEASGQLEKLFGFIIEILRKSDGPKLSNSQLPVFTVANSDATSVAKNALQFMPQTVLGNYSNCQSMQGSLFNGSGVNFYNGLKCLDSETQEGTFSQIAEHLKASGLLPQSTQLLRSLLVTSPYLTATLTQGSDIVKSGDLQNLLRAIAVSDDPLYKVTSKLEPTLARVLENPRASDTLKLLGQIISDEDFKNGLGGFLEANQQIWKKSFYSQNQFRLKARNLQDIRNRIIGWFPEYSTGQVDRLLMQSIDNFETHNDSWKYDEGPFQRMNDVTWRNTVAAFVRSLLRTTSLEEFVKSLQDIGRNFNVPFILTAATNDQRVALHNGSNGQRHIHIQTQLDQIETLLENSHFSVPLVPDAGVHFLLQVKRSSNLPADMRTQYDVIQLGYKGSVVFSPLNIQMHFLNMINNYLVITDFANNGTLKIFQRLVQGAYNSTPQGSQDSGDPNINHIGALRSLTDFGIFENMTMGISSLNNEGQASELINGLLGTCQLLRPEDVKYLRAILMAVPLESFIDQVLAITKNGDGYQNMKDGLFQFVSSYARFKLDPGLFLQSMAIVLQQKTTWDALLRSTLNDLQKPEGDFLKFGLDIKNMRQDALESLKNLTVRNSNLIPAVIQLFSEVYAKNPEEFGRLTDALKDWLADDRVAALHIDRTFQNILDKIQNQSGFGNLLGQILTDDTQRNQLLEILKVLTKNGDLSSLATSWAVLANSGDLDQTLHFIFDNTILKSLRLK